ncbi:exported protein of unknown function [uncultured Sphingopyxis sp.]|uniref:Uncharacterized protein n=1 Tax=uncultured Sphingopyxis sp. TaxID=310581 RepID=A0A1Y5PUT7_9SPHN|nr:hypothetical protein [uncultured Sphingopyxis sp.]SBV33772.1 exported protein of unknown function [uncultured Sphingopyxis sp.]
MFSLLLAAASLTPAFNDASYAELGYANRTVGECTARFGGGSIEIRQAFNEADRTMINVAVVTGKPTRALPVGTKLWVKSSYGPAWRALVIESAPDRLSFAAHNRFVGDLFVEDSLTIALHERIDAGSVGDAVLVDVGSDVSGFREKLASAFDCADSLGI